MGLFTIFMALIAAVLIGIILFFIYIPWKHSKYFKERGVPYAGPGYIRTFRFLTAQTSIADAEMEIYQDALKTKQPIIGFTDSFVNIAYLITDLDLTRNIYVKDFDYFVNRRKFGTEKSNLIFAKMLVGLESEQWKGMRSKLSPTFTTGKIRRMFGIFEKSGERMCEYLKDIVGPTGDDFDLCLVYSKYAMDVIAGCAFGIDSRSFDCKPGENGQFEEMGQRLQFKFQSKTFLKVLLVLAAPKIADFFGIETFDQTPTNYFSKVIKEVMKRRRETGEKQEDFLQLMMDAQEGLLKGEEKETLEVMTGSAAEDSKNIFHEVIAEHGGTTEKLNFDDDSIVANCVLFLLAGFDTLQSLLIFSAYQLALDQEVQEKLYQEVKETVEAKDGRLTYDNINEMTYLDMFINETLRFFPPAQRTERVCSKDYQVPGSSLVIEKGTLVGMPVIGIHHDSQYYENPEKFDPDRFLPENKNARHSYAFAPFGHGPRNCIGMRFALMEAKAVVAALVKSFKLEPCSKTSIPMKYGNSTSLKPIDGMWLNVTPRKL